MEHASWWIETKSCFVTLFFRWFCGERSFPCFNRMDTTHAFFDTPFQQGHPATTRFKKILRTHHNLLGEFAWFFRFPFWGDYRISRLLPPSRHPPFFRAYKDGLCKTGGSPCLDSNKSHDLSLGIPRSLSGVFNPKRGVFLRYRSKDHENRYIPERYK